ncbi:unnamed protein product [Pylaiella littoralis]
MTARLRRRRRRRSLALASAHSSSLSDNDNDDGVGGENSGGINPPPAAVDAELADSGPDPAAEAAITTTTAADGGGSGGAAEAGMGDPSTRATLKQKLLRKVATLNRGFVAQDSDRLDVEEIIEMLEMENPNPKACTGFPSGSSPLSGRWQLLYTTSLDVLSLQINPTVTVGQIFQEIESDGRAIRNIIELQPPFASVNKIIGSSMATLTVKLDTEPVSDSRINLKFVRAEVQANSILGKKLDLPALGVNLPSAETLENILPKGGDGGGISGLKDTVQGARKKARDLLLKTKDKIESNENDKMEFEENANGDADEHSPTAEDDGSSPPSSSSPTSSSSLRMPYFESTYCDEDLRVGRTGQGDVFVSVRA